LLQQLVDECGFAMIHVGDDGDVPDIFDHGRCPSGQGREHYCVLHGESTANMGAAGGN
jgi:hypothetical protein